MAAVQGGTMKTRWICVIICALPLFAGVGVFAEKPARVTAPENPNAWPKRTPEEQAAATAEMKKFAEDTAEKMALPLKIYETKFFIFSSNIPQAEAKNWAGLLDRM